MRPTSDVDAEAWVLTTEAGRGLLAEVARVSAGACEPGTVASDGTGRGGRGGTPPGGLPARGAAKFSRADRLWLEPVGLEQATAERVARHKARRFAGGLVADLCAGIGGDSVALAVSARVLAVDADQGMARRVRWNAEVYEVEGRLAPIRARAESFPLPSKALVHIDPDRRAGAARRARSVFDYVPGFDFLQSLRRTARGGAIKLGPASDFAAHFDSPAFEVELISLGGECKEATVWFGDLTTCGRRATRLPEGATWTDRDASPEGQASVAPLATWVYDPDPALRRSGLLDAFAVRHSLCRCAAGVDYLTSPDRLVSPFLTAFKVVEDLPLDLKALRRAVAAHGLGPLEIKPKGLDIRPETLRHQLRPPGPNPGTLLLVGGGGPARAILARRE